MEEEKIEGSSPRESFEDDTVCEVASSNASTSYSEAGINPKHDSQWRGFFRKLKPAMGLHAFHPTIPSVKKLSKKKSRNLTKSMPGLPSHLDAEFYCLESSWLNFSLSDLENATNHFSHGQYLLQTSTFTSPSSVLVYNLNLTTAVIILDVKQSTCWKFL